VRAASKPGSVGASPSPVHASPFSNALILNGGERGSMREIGNGYLSCEAAMNAQGSGTTIYRLSEFQFFAVLNEIRALEGIETVSVVADFRSGPTGGFFGLNRTATVLLQEFLQHGEDVISQAATSFGVPETRVRDDLRSLLARLQLEHLGKRRLRSKIAQFAARCMLFPITLLAHVVVMSVVRRYYRYGDLDSSIGRSAVKTLLRLVWISLRVFGWQATISQMARFHRDRPLAAGGSVDGIVNAVDEAVRHGAAGLVITVKCAERAIAAHQILRAGFGQPSTLVVCYRPCPRGFHCYVVSHGRILTDTANFRPTFLPVACFT
jgi:hypothetical protein